MRVTMLLADAAQEVNGKLYILGGGWSVTGPDLPPMSLAVKLDVPWSAANEAHRFEIVLVDTDGRPVGGIGDGRGVRVDGSFEVGRPAGMPAGSDIDFAFAINVPPFPLGPGATPGSCTSTARRGRTGCARSRCAPGRPDR